MSDYFSRIEGQNGQMPDPETQQTPAEAPAVSSSASMPEDLLTLPPRYDESMHAALNGLRYDTDISNCLVPLLRAMQWRGHPRHIAESIPHFLDSLDITSLRNILANLRYESWSISITVERMDTRLMPCLFLPENKAAMVLLGRDGDMIRVFDGGTCQEERFPVAGLKGTAYVFQQLEEESGRLQTQMKLGWFRMIIERFRTLGYQVFGLTLMLNLLALATPLFIMAVYDKVVATGSLETLSFFAIGVGIALLCDLVLRGIRSRVLAFIGARLDNIVGNAVFQRILFLPPAFIEKGLHSVGLDGANDVTTEVAHSGG